MTYALSVDILYKLYTLSSVTYGIKPRQAVKTKVIFEPIDNNKSIVVNPNYG